MHRLSQTTPPTRRLISTQSFLLRQSDDLSKKYLKLETLMCVFTEEKQDKTSLTTPVAHQTFPLTFSEQSFSTKYSLYILEPPIIPFLTHKSRIVTHGLLPFFNFSPQLLKEDMVNKNN